MDVGMVFGIIFAVIVIGAVLVFGGNVIAELLRSGGIAQIEKNIDDIGQLTEDVYLLSEGSSRPYTLQMPSDSKLCFIDYRRPGRNLFGDWEPSTIIMQIISDSNLSVWYEYAGIKDGRHIEHLYPDPARGNLCVTGGKVWLTNAGTAVHASS